MVVQGPLDFHFILGEACVYAMEFIISTHFRVISFPHNGNIVTVEKFSFGCLDLISNHPKSLNVPYIQVEIPLPHVNYVETCPIPSLTNENDTLTV